MQGTETFGRRRSGLSGARSGIVFLVGGAGHGQFPDVLVGVENDDVELRGEQTDQSYGGVQARHDAEGRDLCLKIHSRNGIRIKPDSEAERFRSDFS